VTTLRPVARTHRHFLPQHLKALPSVSFKGQGSRFYSATTINVPHVADSVTTAEVGKWNVAEGSFVKRDEIVCVLDTAKVAADVRAPTDGTVTKHLHKEGDEVRVGEPLFEMTAGGEAPKEDKKSDSKKPEAKSEAKSPAKEEKDPKHDAEEHKTPKTEIKAAKPTETTKPAPPKETPKHTESKPAAPAPTKGTRNETRSKMPLIRRTIAQRLKDSQNTAAMLTTFNEVDMSSVMEMRSKYNVAFEKKHGVKLGFMSAFVRASSIALQEFKEVNAYIDGNDIIYHDYVDISVAVATPTGLVVPVLKNTEAMSFADIEKTIGAFGQQARDKTLPMEATQGGTFTISNGGVYGSMMGTPIINPPQSAILGMHAITQRAVVINGEIKARPMMYLALTYDHRIIDGRDAVSFLKKIKTLIEEPQQMLLDL